MNGVFAVVRGPHILAAIGSFVHKRSGYARMETPALKKKPADVFNRCIQAAVPTSSDRLKALRIEDLRRQIEGQVRHLDQLNKKINALNAAIALRREQAPEVKRLDMLATELRRLQGRGSLDEPVDGILCETGDQLHVMGHSPTEKDAPVCLFASDEQEALKDWDVKLDDIVTRVQGNIRSAPVARLLERIADARNLYSQTPSRQDAPQLKMLGALSERKKTIVTSLHVLTKRLEVTVASEAGAVQVH